MRKRCRAVLVVPSHLYDLAPHLRRKNFHPIVLPAGVLDQQQKELLLPHRTLITDKPEEIDADDVPVLEFYGALNMNNGHDRKNVVFMRRRRLPPAGRLGHGTSL
jgi:hypothetical protein